MTRKRLWQSPTASEEGRGIVCLRPEAIRTTSGGVGLGVARILDAAFFGTHWRLHLKPEDAPDLTLVAHLPPHETPEPGALLTLFADPKSFLIYLQDS